jgi:DNA-damage-inducible protein D
MQPHQLKMETRHKKMPSQTQPLLGYTQWRRFEKAIERAISSCKESVNPPENHFAGAGKMVGLGSGSVRDLTDYHLSRFACYLIAQNGDPRKSEIALAQQYFAIQTRRQELSDQFAADKERVELRKQMSEEFKALFGAGQQACTFANPKPVEFDGFKTLQKRVKTVIPNLVKALC